jgi:hypothetical protein
VVVLACASTCSTSTSTGSTICTGTSGSKTIENVESVCVMRKSLSPCRKGGKVRSMLMSRESLFTPDVQCRRCRFDCDVNNGSAGDGDANVAWRL